VIQDYLYHEMLAAEIYRVCKQDGIIFGINADAISILQASGACKNFLPYCKSEPNGILYKTERTDDFSTISSVIESTRAELEHKKTEQ
jgi:hypothetical protein